MKNYKYRKFEITETKAGVFEKKIVSGYTDSLPDSDVLIRVLYSSLNYKDALSSNGHKGITRLYPHTPGVDAAGYVEESLSSEFKNGDLVIVTGYDLGMNTPGGFGEYIKVPSTWIIPLPKSMNLKESMIIGTAGFTSALCIYEFQRRGLFPGDGPVLVTGATGGVGSLSVAMLSKLGYNVTASTGKKDKYDYLSSIGANSIVDRNDLVQVNSRSLMERRWKGVVDNVGGSTLEYCLKTTDYWGTVASVGLVDSYKIETTLYPFILRGIGLVGIDSADRPFELRQSIWTKIASEWKPDNLDTLSREILIEDLHVEIDKIIKGHQVGRVILKHSLSG